jgi:hypothetical protein
VYFYLANKFLQKKKEIFQMKTCRENKNTHFMVNDFFPGKPCCLGANMEKYGTA